MEADEKSMNKLAELYHLLDKCHGSLAKILSRQRESLDRAFGSEPESDKETSEEKSECTVSNLFTIVVFIENRIAELDHQTSRLETLV
jgi:hypothetical protein